MSTRQPPAADPDALLTAVHSTYGAELHRYVAAMAGESRAADVVQETLLRAWRHPDVLVRGDGAVRAWLYTVARNIVVDESRSARRRREVSTDQVPEAGVEDGTQEVLDAWLVADALVQLSAEHRSVVVGAYYRGRSVAELARELDLPPGTVKSRLHYGLRAMRLALQERGVSS